MSDGTGIGRRTCPACETEQPSVAMTCRECGAELLVGESAGRAWLRWGAVGAVVLIGAVGTFLAITALWEPHEEPDTDIAWSVALGAVRDEPQQQARTWYAAPAGDVVVLSSGDALRGVARDTGRIVWRTQVEMTGDVRWDGPPTVADGTAYVAAGSSLQALDPATGEVRWTSTPGSGAVRHVVPHGDVVALGVPPTDVEVEFAVVALDAGTGEERWRDERGYIDTLDAGGGYLFGSHVEHITEEGDGPDEPIESTIGRLVAWDLETGEQRWGSEAEDVHRVPEAVGDLVVVRDQELVVEGPERAWNAVGLVGLDPEDGTEVWRWEPPVGASFHTPTALREGRLALFEGGEEHHELVVLDTATGEELWRADVPPLGPSGMVAASERHVHVTGHPHDEGIIIWTFDLDDGAELWEAHVDAEGAPRGLHADDRGPYLLDEAGGLHGLDPADGSTLWQTAASGEVAATAPAVHDGWAYVVGGDGHLRAIGVDDGEERWSARIGTRGFSQPAVDALGAYAITGLGSIRAIDIESGDEIWRTENRLETLRDDSPSPAVIDGLVVAAVGEEVVGVEAGDGSERWLVALPAVVLQVDVADGLVAAVDEGGETHAIDAATGELRWSRRIGGGVAAVVAVDNERTVALTAEGGLYLIDAADGGAQWDAQLDDPPPAPPGVAEGVVHVVDGGRVRAFDLVTGEERWDHDVGEALAGAATVADGRVHVATAGTAVIVLDAEDGEAIARLDLGQPLTSAPTPVDGRVLVRAGEYLVALE